MTSKSIQELLQAYSREELLAALRERQARRAAGVPQPPAGSKELLYGAGGGIHIKKSNEGKFTGSARRAGMSVQEYARHVLTNKERYSAALVRRANFARNAAGWEHGDGGPIGKELGYGEPTAASDVTSAAPPVADFFGGEVVEKMPEVDLKERLTLGANPRTAVTEQLSALKNESDAESIRALQSRLYDMGYYDNNAILGSIQNKSDAAYRLQELLVSNGYDIGSHNGAPDGLIGSKSRKALKEYMAKTGGELSPVLREIVADGKVGAQTYKAAKQYYTDIADGNFKPFDISVYDKVLSKPVPHTLMNTIGDGINDWLNYIRWNRAVKNAKDFSNGMPQVDVGWRVSDDALARAVSLLPDNLSASSSTNWTSSDKADKTAGYPNTWDSEKYIQSNRTAFTDALTNVGGFGGLVRQSLLQPGRGSIGAFSYRTTPEGIEISDGYQFAAEPKRIVISGKQNESYNKIREEQNVKHRAENSRTQKYFVPWEVYNELHKKP